MKRTVNLREMSAANSGNLPAQGGSQEMQTRKILSDLQKEKARLRMIQQGGPGSGQVRMSMNAPMAAVPPDTPQHVLMNQRTALQMAHSSSFGYFIPQDSAFGNVILPVIPRITQS